MPSCVEWGQERHEECTQTEDQGYNECTESRDEGYESCESWSRWTAWLCIGWTWVSNIVCVAWTWVSKVVCVAWTWVTTAVCVAWDVVTTIVNAVLVTLESILGWVLSAVAFIIEMIQMIPVFGALVRWVINLITHGIGLVLSLPDAFLGLIGIRPEKKLRVCTVVLRDEDGTEVATPEVAKALLQLAVNVYKRDANIRIEPLRPFRYATGFRGADTVADDWFIMDPSNSDPSLLDVSCGPNAGSAIAADWGVTGSRFQAKISTLCFYGSWRRVLGYGAPVTCFIVRSVDGALGCAFWVVDYCTNEGRRGLPHPSTRVIGHEVGHLCYLGHKCVDDDVRNMMATQGKCTPTSSLAPDRDDPRMSNGQAIVVRMSKHVSYF